MIFSSLIFRNTLCTHGCRSNLSCVMEKWFRVWWRAENSWQYFTCPANGCNHATSAAPGVTRIHMSVVTPLSLVMHRTDNPGNWVYWPPLTSTSDQGRNSGQRRGEGSPSFNSPGSYFIMSVNKIQQILTRYQQWELMRKWEMRWDGGTRAVKFYITAWLLTQQ